VGWAGAGHRKARGRFCKYSRPLVIRVTNKRMWGWKNNGRDRRNFEERIDIRNKGISQSLLHSCLAGELEYGNQKTQIKFGGGEQIFGLVLLHSDIMK
jgi:hypothetical protein